MTKRYILDRPYEREDFFPDLTNPGTPFYQKAPGTEMSIPVLDKPRGWLYGGMEFQDYPPASRSWDPAVIAAVREFDPYFVPLWVWWKYKKPYDDGRDEQEVAFGRHVLARAIPDPKAEKEPVYPLHRGIRGLCQGLHHTPNVLIEILEHNNPDPKFHEMGDSELPGIYLPFEWNVYKGLRAMWSHDMKTPGVEDKQNLQDWRDRNDARTRSMAEDWVKDQMDLEKYAKKVLDTLPESEAIRANQYIQAENAGFVPYKPIRAYSH